MTDVQQLGNRIARALDRISHGIEAQDRAALAEQSLFDALQDERARTSALRAELAAADPAPLQARIAAQQAQLQALDAQLHQLRAAHEDLRALTAQLRQSLSDSLAPEQLAALMTESLHGEIAALHRLRAADVAEVNAILAELTPLITPAIPEEHHAAG